MTYLSSVRTTQLQKLYLQTHLLNWESDHSLCNCHFHANVIVKTSTYSDDHTVEKLSVEFLKHLTVCKQIISGPITMLLTGYAVTNQKYLMYICINSINRLQPTAQYVSSWIWSEGRSFQHEWNARGTTIPGWLRNIKKPVTLNAL